MSNDFKDGGVEAGLTLLNLLWPKHLPLTNRDIAFVCGVHHSRIYQMEDLARKKLRQLAEEDSLLSEYSQA